MTQQTRTTEDMMLEAATSSDPSMRVLARLLATDFSDTIDRWVAEEAQRDTEFAMIVHTLATTLFTKVAYTAAIPLLLMPRQHDRSVATTQLAAVLQKHFSGTVPDYLQSLIGAQHDEPDTTTHT